MNTEAIEDMEEMLEILQKHYKTIDDNFTNEDKQRLQHIRIKHLSRYLELQTRG